MPAAAMHHAGVHARQLESLEAALKEVCVLICICKHVHVCGCARALTCCVLDVLTTRHASKHVSVRSLLQYTGSNTHTDAFLTHTHTHTFLTHASPQPITPSAFSASSPSWRSPGRGKRGCQVGRPCAAAPGAAAAASAQYSSR
jgi:hypothetical protein